MSFNVPLYSDLIENKKHVLGSRQDKRWGFTRTNKTNNNENKSNNRRKKNLEFCTCKHHTLPLSQKTRKKSYKASHWYKEKLSFSIQFLVRTRVKTNQIP